MTRHVAPTSMSSLAVRKTTCQGGRRDVKGGTSASRPCRRLCSCLPGRIHRIARYLEWHLSMVFADRKARGGEGRTFEACPRTRSRGWACPLIRWPSACRPSGVLSVKMVMDLPSVAESRYDAGHPILGSAPFMSAVCEHPPCQTRGPMSLSMSLGRGMVSSHGDHPYPGPVGGH
jgi:hypothetical protein